MDNCWGTESKWLNYTQDTGNIYAVRKKQLIKDWEVL